MFNQLPLPSSASILTRRRLLQAGAAVACSSTLRRAFGSGIKPQPAPSGTAAAATLTISPETLGSIGPGFVGFSYEKQNVNETVFASGSGAAIVPNKNLVELFRLLGGPEGSVLRVSGNSADMNVWTGEGRGNRRGKIATDDVDRLAGFLRATGWRCLYGINLGGSAPGAPAPTTKELAASEVAYVQKALGPSLAAIEIGNEPDFWGRGFYKNVTPAWSVGQFIELWKAYAAYIESKVGQVPFAGPDSASNVALLTVPFAKAVGKSALALVTQHYYIAGGQAHPPPTTADLIAYPSPHLEPNVLARLQEIDKTYGLPYRIDECNSFYDGGARGVSDSYASALWAIDFLFTLARHGAQGANFQGGGNSAYTPIQSDGPDIRYLNPVFYGMKFFALAGQGSLLTTKLDGVGTSNVTAFAVASPNGKVKSVVVNNKSEQAFQLAVTFPTGARASSAALMEMTQQATLQRQPNLSATSGVTIQGSGIGANGSYQPGVAYELALTKRGFTCYAPALSAVTISVG